MDWQENHEVRISDIEGWTKRHDLYTLDRVARMAVLETSIKPLERLADSIEKVRTRQDEIVERLSGKIDRLIWGMFLAAVGFIAQLVVLLVKK